MATYQEQIERNKHRKEESASQTLVDIALMTKVEEALSFLVQLNVISPTDRLVLMRKYVDDRPNIKKAIQGK